MKVAVGDKWIETETLEKLDIPFDGRAVIYKTPKGNYIGDRGALVCSYFHITEKDTPELWERVKKYENLTKENQL